MRKIALLLASVAGLGFTAPSFAMDRSAHDGRIQLAQANLSVSVGERPSVRKKVIIRSDRDRGRRNWRHHSARGDSVVIVKKRKPAKRTVIIER